MVGLHHSMRVFDGPVEADDSDRLAEIVRRELAKRGPQLAHTRIEVEVESPAYALQDQACRMASQLIDEVLRGQDEKHALDMEVCIVEDGGVLELEIATNQELPNQFSASRFWGRRESQLSSVSFGCVPCPQGGTTWVARGLAASMPYQASGNYGRSTNHGRSSNRRAA